MRPFFTPSLIQLAGALFSATLGVLLYLGIAAMRPEPFTASVDGIGYFLPLIRAVHENWLNGEPLRILWDLGQGWVPWESGQIGYLYPGYLLATAAAHIVGQPLRVLEYSAMLHMALLGLFAWIAPPVALSPPKRLIYAAAIVSAPGILMIGMNWHNYLAPMPWFILLTGLFLRTTLQGRSIERGTSIALLLVSAMYFSASHPQMYVLGLVLVAGAALVLAPGRRTILNVLGLALLQAPFLAPLLFLYVLAGDASPVWTEARAQASIIKSSLPLRAGLGAMLLGVGAPALFNPTFPILLLLALWKRRWLLVFGALFMAALVVPTMMPNGFASVLESILRGFRWPAKLAVFAYPLMLAAIVSLRPPRAVWYMVAGAIVVSLAHDLTRHDQATSLRSIHDLGVSGVVETGKNCMRELGLKRSDRVAFVGLYRYNKRDNGIPPAMQAMANNAVLLVGLESQHLYEPLEPAGVAAAHDNLTLFWRGSLATHSLDPATLQRLANSGVDVLLASTPEFLVGLSGNITRCQGGAFALRIGNDSAFPAERMPEVGLKPLVRLADGSLKTGAPLAYPPVVEAWRVQQRPDRWRMKEDGHWYWQAPFPGLRWLVSTALGWGIAVAFAWTRPKKTAT